MNNKYQSAIELKLLEALYSIKAAPEYIYHGICDNVDCFLADLDDFNNNDRGKVQLILQDLNKSWPKFSGDEVYPIKAPGYETAAYSYLAEANHNKWEGEYGNLRKELLEFLINSLENKT